MRLSLILVLSAAGLCAQEQGRVEEYIAGQQIAQAPAVGAQTVEGQATAQADAQEQARLEQQTAETAKKLAELERKLAQVRRGLGGSSAGAVKLSPAGQGACSIPLRQVGSAADFPSKMRIINPGSNLETGAFEKAPKAPPCEETINK